MLTCTGRGLAQGDRKEVLSLATKRAGTGSRDAELQSLVEKAPVREGPGGRNLGTPTAVGEAEAKAEGPGGVSPKP